MSILGKYNYLSPNSRLYLLFISFFWLYGFFGAFWIRVGLNYNVANAITLIFLAFLCRGKWHRLIRTSDVILYFLFILLYFLSSIIYPISRELVQSNAFDVLCVAVPFFFIGIIFKTEEYKDWLTTLSRLAIIINLIFSVLTFTSGEIDEESQHRAYVLLPSVLFVLWQLFERLTISNLAYFLLGFIMECSLGTRGPFVCILFFAITYLFFFKDWKHKGLVRILLIAVAASLFVLSKFIAEFMILVLSALGQSTRIFDNMMDKSLLNYESSTGRDIIHEMLFNQLNTDEGGIGFGIFSDRLFADGFSSHNIVIELWFSFGYYIGSVLLMLFLLLFVVFFNKSNKQTKALGLIFFSASFIKLLFSGCFILDGYLFFLIGLCINGIRASKSKTVIDYYHTNPSISYSR